jgi:hypothetical protein
VEDAATTEGPEVLGSAVGVGALDSGGTPAVVTAAHKAIHRLGDPRQSELPEALGELILVAGDEPCEVGTEASLEGARSPLSVAAGGRRIQRERQLVCHMNIDGRKERAAFTPLSRRTLN